MDERFFCVCRVLYIIPYSVLANKHNRFARFHWLVDVAKQGEGVKYIYIYNKRIFMVVH